MQRVGLLFRSLRLDKAIVSDQFALIIAINHRESRDRRKLLKLRDFNGEFINEWQLDRGRKLFRISFL